MSGSKYLAPWLGVNSVRILYYERSYALPFLAFRPPLCPIVPLTRSHGPRPCYGGFSMLDAGNTFGVICLVRTARP